VVDIDPAEWQRHRPYLLGVAYRLLGAVAAAEDAVQEAYLRLRRDDVTGVVDIRAWLVIVVSRICLDELRSARARRESYVGPWLPEPLVGDPMEAAVEPDPADRVTLAESVEMALLVVLEALTPAERIAFVLHDVFGMDYPQVAGILGRTEPACRQLASRARRRVRDQTPRFDVDTGELHRLVAAFMAATSRGDLATLVSLLDPDVVMYSDGGGRVRTALRPVQGADKVSRFLIGVSQLYPGVQVRQATVNGRLGFLLYEPTGRLLGVTTVAAAGGRVCRIYLVLNPDKLRHVQPAGPPVPPDTASPSRPGTH
jgi:RNA polymerase sigma-70 factor, ECF subfamily